MNNVHQLKNRHPADELADVRHELKQLENREQELRNQLLAQSNDRRGVEWSAKVVDQKRNGYDLKAIKEHFGTAALQPFAKTMEFKLVKLIKHKAAEHRSLIDSATQHLRDR